MVVQQAGSLSNDPRQLKAGYREEIEFSTLKPPTLSKWRVFAVTSVEPNDRVCPAIK